MSKEAFDKVKLARSNSRPTGLDYIEHIFGNFFELHGDRAFGDDKAVVSGVAFLNDLPVTVIAT
ncbi:MAG: acetyl-CoA carboxylase carboxyl transferase subunit alpha, partial [Clostridiales bacterium]|nr:acetyl-CoA carboxylase carboxyl transferase subunit alpha [Clostridiales bacterium]